MIVDLAAIAHIVVVSYIVGIVAAVIREIPGDIRRKRAKRSADALERADLRRRENEVRARLGMPLI